MKRWLYFVRLQDTQDLRPTLYSFANNRRGLTCTGHLSPFSELDKLYLFSKLQALAKVYDFGSYFIKDTGNKRIKQRTPYTRLFFPDTDQFLVFFLTECQSSQNIFTASAVGLSGLKLNSKNNRKLLLLPSIIGARHLTYALRA